MAAITIGVDARAASEVLAGRGRYVREQLLALARLGGDERYRLFCREPAPLDLDPTRFEWVRLGLRDPLWHLRAALVANRSCDVFWSTNSYLTAWATRIPTAVTVHDLIAFVPGAGAQRRAARIERTTIRPAIARAAALLCCSEATRRDLVARYPSAAGRAVVTPLAADGRFGAPRDDHDAVRAHHGLERPFVLAAGTLEPRKNLERLMDAWALLDARDHDLVLVGPLGWDFEQLVRRARAGRVRVLGRVSDDDLAALYGLCTVFCYPSLYEGFGLPVLEAMASGAPVVTSSVSSLPEVAGDAAVLVDPLDVGAIAEALRRLLDDPQERARLGTAGRDRAARFSWEATAGASLEALTAIAR